MLAIFHKAFAHPPEELNSPASHHGSKKPKLPEETLKEFLSHHPHNNFSMGFGDAAVLAYVKPDQPYSLKQRYSSTQSFPCFHSYSRSQVIWLSLYVYKHFGVFFHFRLFCGFDDIYCLFLGSLNNLCMLNKQYGLTKNTNEAMFVIEAYRTLRDRGPYPADQVVKDLDGSFAFVVYDSKVGSVFTALVIN